MYYCAMSTPENMRQTTDISESTRLHNEKFIQELKEKREKGEIAVVDFDLNTLSRLNDMDLPLRRRDLETQPLGQALVLTQEDLEKLGYIDFIHVTGERMVIESDSLPLGRLTVIYPTDLGNEEKTNI